MSYTALYRKFRPQTFDDVKGQDIIVSALKNQIAAGRIGHAFLFTGTRGVGKTTAAKIFARAVNCTNPQNGDPCGECEMCKKILAGTSMNVVEMDAASNNSVDNIREIIDEVEYSPTEGKYKVYIIDEVHMLSGNAFNALLKTLEEPPSYVIFILATTEAHKIPITILSRCQRYDFRRATSDEITERLRTLVDREQVKTEDKALKYIAILADGSFRDGISLLDKCISFYLGEELTYDKVLKCLGTVDAVTHKKLMYAIRTHDVNGALRIIDGIVTEGGELTHFSADFTWYLRDILVAKAAGNTDFINDIPTSELKGFTEEVNEASEELILRTIRIFSALTNDIKLSASKRVETEVAVIKACSPLTDKKEDSFDVRLAEIENKLEKGFVEIKTFADDAPKMSKAAGMGEILKNNARDDEIIKQNLIKKAEALPEDLKNILMSWDKITAGFTAFYEDIKKAKLSISDDNRIIVNVRDDFIYRYMTGNREGEKSGKEMIEEAIFKYTGKQADIELRYTGNEKKAPVSEENADFVALLKEIGSKNIPVEINE